MSGGLLFPSAEVQPLTNQRLQTSLATTLKRPNISQDAPNIPNSTESTVSICPNSDVGPKEEPHIPLSTVSLSSKKLFPTISGWCFGMPSHFNIHFHTVLDYVVGSKGFAAGPAQAHVGALPVLCSGVFFKKSARR